MVIDQATLARTAAAFAAGRGPVAVDAERASGFRYSQRAYLVQLRRAGAGTALIDPIPLDGDLSELAPALTGPEWVLHAANQDLPCLAEIGLVPTRLFDTELAGRLAGLPRVGLGPLVEQLLGLRLEKGHGAADWSRRPLPEDWLVYAALDVEVLVAAAGRARRAARRAGQAGLGARGVRGRAHRGAAGAAGRAMAAHLRHPQDPQAPRTGHCAGTVDGAGPAGRRAGHRAGPGAARLRRSWTRRQAAPDSAGALAAMPVFRGRAQRRLTNYWYAAVAEAAGLDARAAAAVRRRRPRGRRRWRAGPTATRTPRPGSPRPAPASPSVAQQWSIPVENLLQPELLRRLCWSPPDDGDLAGALRKGAAREWQISLLAPVLEGAFAAAARIGTRPALRNARRGPPRLRTVAGLAGHAGAGSGRWAAPTPSSLTAATLGSRRSR